LSKPSFLTESFGRGSLSIIVVSILLLVITTPQLATSQQNEGAYTQETYRRIVQTYIQTGEDEYKKGYFEQAEKTFLMAQGYQEYLTAEQRKHLQELLGKAQIAVAKRKRALSAFAVINKLIKQDQLIDAKTLLEKLKDDEFLTTYEQAQISEVLRQINAQIIEDKAPSEQVKDKKYHEKLGCSKPLLLHRFERAPFPDSTNNMLRRRRHFC